MRVGPGHGRAAAPRRSSGRTAAPPRAARSCAPPGTSRWCARAPGWCSTPTSRPPRSSGCSSTSTGCASGRASGRAVFGTVDSWLLFKLTGEHVTDPSNASRTMLYDIAERALGPGAAGAVRRARARAAARAARAPASVGRDAPARRCTATPCPVAGVAGDQQAALFGQACVDPGMGKNTYGTGSFLLLNAGFTSARAAPPGLLRDGRLGDRRARRAYALEASIFVTGAAVQWLRDGLRIIERAAETEALAASLQGNDGVYFVPALTGLGSPHWDARRARHDRRAHARHRSRAPRARDARGDRLPDASTRCARWRPRRGEPLRELRVDGGATRERLADAVPGRRARRAGRAAARSPRRPRSAPPTSPGSASGCGRSSDVRAALARARALRAAHERGRARDPARPAGSDALARARGASAPEPREVAVGSALR